MAKGSMIDLFYLITFLVLLAVVSVIVVWMSDLLMPVISSTVTGQTAKDITGSTLQAFQAWDSVFLMVAVGSPLVMLILAFQIRTHPAFFLMGLLIYFVLLFVTPLYSNIVRSVASFEMFTGVIDKMPFLATIFENYSLFTVGVGLLSLVIIYSRRGGGEEL